MTTKTHDSNTKIENVSIDKLVPYARNSRTHSDAQVAQIAASSALFTKAARHNLEPAWVADTQRKIQTMGLWPENLERP